MTPSHHGCPSPPCLADISKSVQFVKEAALSSSCPGCAGFAHTLRRSAALRPVATPASPSGQPLRAVSTSRPAPTQAAAPGRQLPRRVTFINVQPGLNDNTARWFLKQAVQFFATVIFANRSYSEPLGCEIKCAG